ncbi:MAG TPA: RNA methyltransferase [Candidatus Polarisedimenticolia bacterium]|jgi:TrmH family RNA methyltransferase|nr:RNA methyltransferase [Candidatus Polarisedimenticolia bacterium]
MNVPKEVESRLRRVSSRQNALVKDLRKALSQGEPTAEGYLAVEGVRMIEEAIRSGLRFQAVFFSEAGSTNATRLLPQIGSQVEILLLPDEVFVSAVSTETPQGVAALVKLRPNKFDDLLETGPDPLLVGVAGIQDPGNLGTIIRSAEAFGARAVLLGEKTVSHFNSKTVRGSAGSLFRQPLLRVKLGESITTLKQQGVRVLATSSHKGKPLQEANFTGAAMIVVGNEGAGVPAEILSMADELVTIPHSLRVESLNAGIAASILLYEAARQRTKTSPRINTDL